LPLVEHAARDQTHNRSTWNNCELDHAMLACICDQFES
jgi:hypothetical protein